MPSQGSALCQPQDDSGKPQSGDPVRSCHWCVWPGLKHFDAWVPPRAGTGRNSHQAPSIVPFGFLRVPGCRCPAGCVHKHVAAGKDGCHLDAFSRDVCMPATPMTVGQTLQRHQGTHIQHKPQELDPAMLWACLCNAGLCARIVSPLLLLFIFYFSPSLHACANEYFMARKQREFPRSLLLLRQVPAQMSVA